MSILIQLPLQFNSVLLITPVDIFNRNLQMKMVINAQGLEKQAKTKLKERRKMREFMLLDIMYYCKTVIIKAIRYWHKYGQKTMIYNPWLVLAKNSQKIQRREFNFFQEFLFWIIGYPDANQKKTIYIPCHI